MYCNQVTIINCDYYSINCSCVQENILWIALRCPVVSKSDGMLYLAVFDQFGPAVKQMHNYAVELL